MLSKVCEVFTKEYRKETAYHGIIKDDSVLLS